MTYPALTFKNTNYPKLDYKNFIIIQLLNKHWLYTCNFLGPHNIQKNDYVINQKNTYLSLTKECGTKGKNI